MRVEVAGIEQVIEHLSRYRTTLEQKKRIFMERLAGIGVQTANTIFSTAQYDGPRDVTVPPAMWVDDRILRIVATGHTALFIEFGAGPGGVGHEMAGVLGYGPGTWSDDPTKGGKGQWNNPEGWIYQHDAPRSHGNPPARAMYQAGKDMHLEVLTIAREVFGVD